MVKRKPKKPDSYADLVTRHEETMAIDESKCWSMPAIEHHTQAPGTNLDEHDVYRCDLCVIWWRGSPVDKTIACPVCGSDFDYREKCSLMMDLVDEVISELTFEVPGDGYVAVPQIIESNLLLPGDHHESEE